VITSLKTRETSAGVLEWTAVILAGVVAIGTLRLATPSAASCPSRAPTIVIEDQPRAQTETEAIIKDMMLHD
jgi:hypothetical protein